MSGVEVFESSVAGVPCLRVIGEVDHESAPMLERSIVAVLGDAGARLFLDLAGCPYVDSGGLSVLLLTLRRVDGRGGWLGIVGPGEDLRRLFEIVGLKAASGFRIFSSADEAATAAE